MVTFGLNKNVFEVIDIAVTGAKGIDEEWFTEDITLNTSNIEKGSSIVSDFAYDISSIIEYTLDGGTTWIAFNENVAFLGGQSQPLRVTNGVVLNFRAKIAGNLIRCVVGEGSK